MTAETDEELMKRLTEGDEVVLGALFRRHAPRLFGPIARALDASAADDVLQDVLLAVWKQAKSFDPQRGSFRAWIQQIARSYTLNELRRRKRHPADAGGDELGELWSDLPTADEAAWRAHQQQAVRAAVEALPNGQRQALRNSRL